MLDTLSDQEWRLARLDLFGLKEDPFKLSADPRYLYLGPEHLAVYRQAQSVISRRRGLALITGDMEWEKVPWLAESMMSMRLRKIWFYVTSIQPRLNRRWMQPGKFLTGWVCRLNAASKDRWRGWKEPWQLPIHPGTMWWFYWMTPN